jgi:F-type H+-transporting ATPase subunit gamma
MPSLKELRGRIKSAKNIQQITKAMKMVAAARLRRSQERMLAARPFADKISSVISDISAGSALRSGEEAGMDQPLLEMRPGALDGSGTLHLVVIAADKGLCGAFNVNVLRRATQIIRASQDKRPIKVTVVGRKARDFFRNFGVDFAAQHVLVFQNLQYAFAEVLSQELIESFVSRQADEVVLIYTHYVSTMTLKVEEQCLLPFSSAAAAAPAGAGPGAGAGAGKAAGVEYEFEPERDQILKALLPRAIGMQVWRALLESQASEFAARMTAMDSATRNSKEMISSLTLKSNRIRQAVITKEIAELVGGAEALK